MVERSLSMREVRGSMPLSSIFHSSHIYLPCGSPFLKDTYCHNIVEIEICFRHAPVEHNFLQTNTTIKQLNPIMS